MKKYTHKNDKDTHDKFNVEIHRNHIYFYSDITDDKILDLIDIVTKLEDELLLTHIKTGIALEHLPIHLHISSGGGDAYAGLNGYNYLSNLKVPLYTYVEGFVASAGTFLAIAGKKRYMQKYATLMVHQVSFSTGETLTYEKIKDEKIALDIIMAQITDIYAKHTKQKKPALLKILKNDTFMNCDTAKENRFIHEII